MLSTAGNSYDADYFGDTSKFPKAMRAQHNVPDGENWDETIFNVFKKAGGTTRHFWGSEMSFAPPAPKQHHRAGDLADPLWGLLDMTPEGRGDFFPKVTIPKASVVARTLSAVCEHPCRDHCAISANSRSDRLGPLSHWVSQNCIKAGSQRRRAWNRPRVRSPDTETSHLTGPVWLIRHLRNDHLRDANLRRRHRRACAAVMDYGSDFPE